MRSMNTVRSDKKKLMAEASQLAMSTRQGLDVILDWLADPSDKRSAEEVLDCAVAQPMDASVRNERGR